MKAYLFDSLADKQVRCNLCHHRCLIKNNKRGICQVRQNIDGTLESLVYGKVVARHVDPIEKKPLFHFIPVAFPIPLQRWDAISNVDSVRMPISPSCPRIERAIIGDMTTPDEVVAAAAGTQRSPFPIPIRNRRYILNLP